MARNTEEESRGLGRLRNAVKRVFTRRRAEESAPPVAAAPAQPQRKRHAEAKARPARREADIPLDVLDRSYTPPVTSSKASFRSDGADHEHDQEFSGGIADARWNDEDHYTNKSGDPRIGTRGRTYEAGNTLGEPRDEQR